LAGVAAFEPLREVGQLRELGSESDADAVEADVTALPLDPVSQRHRAPL
jgi:hypothetical protein